MAMKQWVGRLQPLALYVMLAATLVFLALQLVLAHVTHALTLLVDAYHMLCNLIALAGCIATIKYSAVEHEEEAEAVGAPADDAPPPDVLAPDHQAKRVTRVYERGRFQCTALEEQRRRRAQGRRRLMNTFGWARIDVLTMLVVCVLLASFCFSLVVEALQTLVHIGHQDEMHHPLLVLAMGTAGLLLNGLCYLLIGGYTFHQASFLHVTASGEVVLEHAVTRLSVQQGRRRLSSQSRRPAPPPPQHQPRQGPREMCRDTFGSILVIICAVIVYFTDAYVAKFVDPVLSIISAVSLLVLSYPYMKESGLILLQTIPDTINIESFRVELIKEFPDIINVHDLHVWRLTPSKVFCTAHIIFINPKDYTRKSQRIIDFFQEQGITQVTVQPEFFETDNSANIMVLPSIEDKSCLVQCRGPGCLDMHCCLKPDPELTVAVQDPNSKNHPKELSDNENAKVQPQNVKQSKLTSEENNESNTAHDIISAQLTESVEIPEVKSNECASQPASGNMSHEKDQEMCLPINEQVPTSDSPHVTPKLGESETSVKLAVEDPQMQHL